MTRTTDKSGAPHLTALARQINLRFIWFVGYAGFLSMSLVYLIFGSSSDLLYRWAMLFLIISLSISTFNAIKPSGAPVAWNGATVERFFRSESSPFLILSAYMYMASHPLVIVLAPMIIYAVYHFLAYVKTVPAVTSSAAWNQYGGSAAEALIAVHPTATTVAAQLEVFVLPYLIIGLFGWGTSFVSILVYSQFLRWQYMVSLKTRQAIQQWDDVIRRGLRSSGSPPIVRNGYEKLRVFLAQTTPSVNPPSSTSASGNPVSSTERVSPNASATNINNSTAAKPAARR